MTPEGFSFVWQSTGDKSQYTCPTHDGYYLTVVAGHSARYQRVSYWDGDDMEWDIEHTDPATRVTHYTQLPHMPEDSI